MIRIPVHTHIPYEIQIERGLLPRAGEAVRTALPRAATLALVYDRELRDLYRDDLLQSLRGAGFEVFAHSLRGGADTKDANTLRALLTFLSERELGRNDALIALGGGALMDVAGLAAALHLRGIGYVNMPSTLSAMVDACAGGRTGIHTRAGRDQVGAFYQPALVLVDPDLLSTLDEAHMRSGMMECLRCGVIEGDPLFSMVAPGFDVECAIAHCLRAKALLVAADERDMGEARVLSLGRAVGHALASRADFELTHGEALGHGMSIVARAACAAGHCAKDASERIQAAISGLLACARPECTAKQLAGAVLAAENPTGGVVALAIPERIGRVRMLELTSSELEAFLKPALRKRGNPEKK